MKATPRNKPIRNHKTLLFFVEAYINKYGPSETKDIYDKLEELQVVQMKRFDLGHLGQTIGRSRLFTNLGRKATGALWDVPEAIKGGKRMKNVWEDL